MKGATPLVSPAELVSSCSTMVRPVRTSDSQSGAKTLQRLQLSSRAVVFWATDVLLQLSGGGSVCTSRVHYTTWGKSITCQALLSRGSCLVMTFPVPDRCTGQVRSDQGYGKEPYFYRKEASFQPPNVQRCQDGTDADKCGGFRFAE